MAKFEIRDEELGGLKHKVAIITGALPPKLAMAFLFRPSNQLLSHPCIEICILCFSSITRLLKEPCKYVLTVGGLMPRILQMNK